MNARRVLSTFVAMFATAACEGSSNETSSASSSGEAVESSSGANEATSSTTAPEESESDGEASSSPDPTGSTSEASTSGGSEESTGSPGEVEVVEFVELERYLGTWYELASYPDPFSGSCVGTTATYSANEDGTVGVLNRCTLGSADGQPVEIEGYAEVVDPRTNAKLLVYFGGGTGAEYWVVSLDDTAGTDPYAWAVVSNSSRSSLFILSRTPAISDEIYQTILDDLAARGWDLEPLEPTEQPDAN